jgi:hypothetical protein
MKLNISSGEDAMPKFKYEPSWDHTLDSFKGRMAVHAAMARKDQEAIEVEEPFLEGCPWDQDQEDILLDEYEQAMGG